MAILSRMRLAAVEPRKVMRTWVPIRLGVSSDARNRLTTQNPSRRVSSVVSVVGGGAKAAVKTSVVVADWNGDGSEKTVWPRLSSKPSTKEKTWYSCVVPATRPVWEKLVTVGSGRGTSVNVPPGGRSCSLNRVATVDALVQDKLI